MAAPRAAGPPDSADDAARAAGCVPGALGGRAPPQSHQSAVHQLSLDDLADLPGDAERHAAAGEHPHPHLGDHAGDSGRLHGRDGARDRDRRRTVVVECALQGARPLSRRGQCLAEDGICAAVLHLAWRHAVDLRHVARDLSLHHHPDDLFGLPGRRPEQDQARADLRRDEGDRFSPRSYCQAACLR